MNIEDSQDCAKQGIEALREVYGQAPAHAYIASMRSERDKTLIIDFFTDVMHLLGNAEATRLFDKAGDHWEEERAK